MKNNKNMSDADWAKFDELTDAEIEAAIADDPDSQVPTDPEFWAKGAWVEGSSSSKNQQIILPISVDAKTADFLTEHHIDYQGLVSGLLKVFVESSREV